MKYYEFFTAEAVAKEFDAMEQKITEHLSGEVEVVRGFKDAREETEKLGVESTRLWLADDFRDELEDGHGIFTSYTLGNMLALTVMEKMDRDFTIKAVGRDVRFERSCIPAFLRARALVKIRGVSEVEGEIQGRLEKKFDAQNLDIYDERFWGDMWAVMEYYFESDFFLEGAKE